MVVPSSEQIKIRKALSISDSDYVVAQNPHWGGHYALVWLVGFKMAGFMLSGTGIRMFVLGKWEYGIRVEWMGNGQDMQCWGKMGVRFRGTV